MNGIKENAALVMSFLKTNFNSSSYADGAALIELTKLSANDLNDAIDYLSSKKYIDRLDFLGTRPFNFGGVKLTIQGKLQLEELEETASAQRLPSSENAGKHEIDIQPVGKSGNNDDIFVSYSWDGEDHENRVHAFVEFLRNNGFDAKMDKMLAQEQTSINFKQMMHQALNSCGKVVVILSPGYKTKADEFKGGVGTEYRMLINDIETRPQKYILFSFQDISPSIIPFGLQGNEVIVEHAKLWQERLFKKLSGEKLYHFSPVADKKPSIPIIEGVSAPFPLKSVEFRSKRGNTWKAGTLVRTVDYRGELIIENIAQSTIENFCVELVVPAQIVPQPHSYRLEGRSAVITFDMNKIFPGQTINTPSLDLHFASHQNINEIFSSTMKVKFYINSGQSPEFVIPLTGPFLIDANYGQQEVLTKDHFAPSF